MATKNKNEANEAKIKSTKTETCKKKATTSVACKNANAKQPEKTSKASVKTTAEPKTKSATTEKVEKTKKPIYRVVYDKDSRMWKIMKDGAKRTIASFVTKDEALARVKDLSESNDLNFIVHKKDGKFQKKK